MDIRKKVTIFKYDLYNTGGIIETIYEEGIPFPSDWEWLSNFLTNWEIKSKDLSHGIPSDDYLKQTYGKDVKIIKLI